MNQQTGSMDYYEIRIEFLSRVLAHDPTDSLVLSEIRDLQDRRRQSSLLRESVAPSGTGH